MLRIIMTASAALLMTVPAVAQEERQTSLEDVPSAALAAAMAAAGVEEFESVGLDLDGGIATYEFSWTDADGMSMEVDVTDSGEVLEVEREVTLDDVPEQVATLLRKYFPDMDPELIELSTRSNFETFYEFEGTSNGEEIDVEVRADGHQIIIQDDPQA